MPTTQIKEWAKESGKSVKEVEEAWEKAKTEADRIYKDQGGQSNKQYWGYTSLRTRVLIGLDNGKSKKKED